MVLVQVVIIAEWFLIHRPITAIMVSGQLQCDVSRDTFLLLHVYIYVLLLINVFCSVSSHHASPPSPACPLPAGTRLGHGRPARQGPPREGRLAGPIVRCGRWTNRVVELDGNTTAKFESTKITNRCTVLYKPTNCTGPIKLTCSKFLVDNRDPMHCKKGDSFITKPAAKNNTV